MKGIAAYLTVSAFVGLTGGLTEALELTPRDGIVRVESTGSCSIGALCEAASQAPEAEIIADVRLVDRMVTLTRGDYPALELPQVLALSVGGAVRHVGPVLLITLSEEPERGSAMEFAVTGDADTVAALAGLSELAMEPGVQDSLSSLPFALEDILQDRSLRWSELTEEQQGFARHVFGEALDFTGSDVDADEVEICLRAGVAVRLTMALPLPVWGKQAVVSGGGTIPDGATPPLPPADLSDGQVLKVWATSIVVAY